MCVFVCVCVCVHLLVRGSVYGVCPAFSLLVSLQRTFWNPSDIYRHVIVPIRPTCLPFLPQSTILPGPGAAQAAAAAAASRPRVLCSGRHSVVYGQRVARYDVAWLGASWRSTVPLSTAELDTAWHCGRA